ncbi:hypothetical protein ZIOFF_023678 [Zingiber officinale]|uniref:Uncharacterized protein n=1 Tax=Zingiber officinale TaxID=94328 RepID=A0A8J5H6X6_ZINOF|nr:hypothetical protein ZIOFF_023678 [Zingiber officinale]
MDTRPLVEKVWTSQDCRWLAIAISSAFPPPPSPGFLACDPSPRFSGVIMADGGLHRSLTGTGRSAAVSAEDGDRLPNLVGRSAVRKRLSDITNTASAGTSAMASAVIEEGKFMDVSSKDCVSQLMMENTNLLKLLAEKNKLIELSDTELKKLQNKLHKSNQQNRHLARVNSDMFAANLVSFLQPMGSEDSHRHLKLMGDLGQIVPMEYNPRDENSIKVVMAKANVVINLIGREYETRNYSFEEVNHAMAEQLAAVEDPEAVIVAIEAAPDADPDATIEAAIKAAIDVDPDTVIVAIKAALPYAMIVEAAPVTPIPIVAIEGSFDIDDDDAFFDIDNAFDIDWDAIDNDITPIAEVIDAPMIGNPDVNWEDALNWDVFDALVWEDALDWDALDWEDAHDWDALDNGVAPIAEVPAAIAAEDALDNDVAPIAKVPVAVTTEVIDAPMIGNLDVNQAQPDPHGVAPMAEVAAEVQLRRSKRTIKKKLPCHCCRK